MLFEKKVLPTCTYSSIDMNSVNDIKDGSIHNSFKSANLNNKTYSFTINTDGISLCDKSNLSIWPVFLEINEIAIKNRYYIDNVIIAGQFVIYFKPNSLIFVDASAEPGILICSPLNKQLNKRRSYSSFVIITFSLTSNPPPFIMYCYKNI